MTHARYIGDGVFRFGDQKILKGDIVDGLPSVIEVLLGRADFEPASGPAPADVTPIPMAIEEDD